MRWTQTVNGDKATIAISGNIDETANQSLLDLASAISAPKLVFDCQAINTVNSVGISAWATFIKGLQSRHQLAFAKCPQVFIDVCLMIPIVTGGGVIESFYLSYPCETCEKTTNILVESKSLADPGSLVTRNCERCGQKMTANEDLDDYLNMLNITD